LCTGVGPVIDASTGLGHDRLRSVVVPVGIVTGDEFGALLTPPGLGVELFEGELAQ
jgi:hypothetical protein